MIGLIILVLYFIGVGIVILNTDDNITDAPDDYDGYLAL